MKDDMMRYLIFFARMGPYEGAINAYHHLARFYDVYILSTAPWNNPSALVR